MRVVTAGYRQQTLALRAQTLSDFARLWPRLSTQSLDSSFPALLAAVRLLIERDSGLAIASAGDYIRAAKLVQGAPGAAVVVAGEIAAAGQIDASLHTTTVTAVRRSFLAGLVASAALDNAFVMASGAVTRLVLNAGRQTVMRSVAADPHGKAWERVTSGRNCNFCNLLAGKISKGKSSVDFPAHDHCDCSAEPRYF